MIEDAADNVEVIVESVFKEISKTLYYIVDGMALEQPFSWEHEHMIPAEM